MGTFSILSSTAGHLEEMRMVTRRLLVGATLSTALLTAMPVFNWALADKKRKGRDDDHDQAFRARQGGVVLPLAEVLAMVRSKIDGEIIETEFEYEHGIPVYEFKYVNRQGQVRELYADARNGAVLKDKPD